MNESHRADKISIGLLLTHTRVPAWQRLAILKVAELKFVEIKVLLVESGGEKPDEQYPAFNAANWLLRLLLRFDKSLFEYKRRPDALALVDIKDVIGDTEEIAVELSGDAGQKVLADEYCAILAAAKLDILIDAGVWLSAEHANLARYGIWRIIQHPSCGPSNTMPGVWESLDSMPVTGSRLEVLTHENSMPLIIDKSWSTTYGLSPSANRNVFSWTSAVFLARQIGRLREQGYDQFVSQHRSVANEFRYDSLPMHRVKSLRTAVSCWFRYTIKIARRVVYEKLNWDQWYLKFSLDSASDTAIESFEDIVPPKDEFWADPHILKREGSYFVFIEVYTKKARKGHISVLKMEQDGSYSDPVKILETDYHLSYPMIVEEEGKLFMIPETKSNQTIELYECIEFPYQWEFRMNLMTDIRATDATPFRHDGKWWIFAAVQEVNGSQCREELHLFHSDDLLSDQWVPHPLNPVVSDARSARPAGKIIASNGKLIRPSQNCSYNYGYGLAFNEIKILSDTDYSEETISFITPDWEHGVSGVHSYSREGNLTVIDAIRGISRW